MSLKENELILIIGGGPAGFGSALAFHNSGYKNIVVVEARADMNFDEENSYLVGVNVRGRNAIRNLFEKADQMPDVSSLGLRVDMWKILVGPGINVANFESGLVTSFSRAGVTLLLYEQCLKCSESVKILLGHKFKSLDLKKKTVVCETESGEEKRFEPACVLVCDGYRSKSREQLAEQDASFEFEQWPWQDQYRMLITDSNKPTDLSPFIHYIYNRVYISKFHSGRWTAAMAIQKNSPEFLLSNEPTDKNVKLLRDYLKKIAPPAERLFTDDELRKYFTRSVFSGAVTKVSKLVVADWALILGDAAHSTIPATGEGINSALEDCFILQKSLQSNPNLKESLIGYEKDRLEDVQALSKIAYAAARPNLKSGFQLFALSLFRKLSLVGPGKEDLMFGKSSAIIQRYGSIYNTWQEQTRYLGGPNIPNV